MKYTQLKTSIAEDGAQNIYLLEGDDAYFRQKGEEMIKSAFLQFPELNFSSFEGDNLKGAAWSEFVAAVKNYPFMAEKRIVKVTEFYPTEAEFERTVEPLFADFPSTAILVIVNAGSKKGVDLKRRREVCYVDCSRADRDTVTKWIYVSLKRAKINAAVSVCEAIADYCICDMARVSVEVQKLIDYKGQGELTRAEADALVYQDAEYKIYELTNAVAAGNFTAFCRISDDLKRKGYDEIAVLNSLFSFFRNLLTVLTSDQSNAELAKLLKMKEYGVQRSREQARAMGERRLCGLVNEIYARISEVKSGQTSPRNALQNVRNTIFFGHK